MKGKIRQIVNAHRKEGCQSGCWCHDIMNTVEGVADAATFMEEARGIAAQCWCDPETSDREMDVILAEAVAKRICFWMDTAAQNQRNTEYYRSLLVRCGEAIGDAAYTQDDGGTSEDVLCAKIPDLVDIAVSNSRVCIRCDRTFDVSRLCPECIVG